ncbi:ABC transporter permease [Rhabdobacter roseus]|uniref:ABC-type antimicrobial peptide transport system permease subunit n=1 Tax=Rhabdobacter roseus TaxID=1655419 RepID=A0A840U0D4_9BACT|nr:ABC transporter permease [Rhabdobacter roseus]MBB5285600.1 ABC-type antimicrobial peptide transport system permease subunit [Rhabdobacter roseus]
MIRNFLKIAWRNLVKNKVYSFINISGLATGMAVAMLIGLWIYDELSYNTYHPSYEDIAQVMQKQTSNGKTYTGSAIPFPLGKELQEKYGSSFKYLVMSSWEGEHFLSVGDTKLNKTGNFMDADAAKLLSLKMLKGTQDGLKDPNSILLAASTAQALFGSAEPLDKVLKINNKLDVKVTGVYEDIPHNNQFSALTFIAPWDLYVASEEWIQRARDNAQWGNNSFQLFAQIADNADFAAVDKRILKSKYNNVSEGEKKFDAQIFLHPMRDWRLRSHWENGVQTGGLIEYVWLFGIIGIFVLLLACINFMNLSTARSEKRAKEVGIRKAIGSVRGQLISQFFNESLLVASLAFVLSLVLVQLVLPWFNQVADKQMLVLWASPWFWLGSIGFTVLTGLVAGSYPALYLSSFQPIKVLKGTFKVGRFASVPRQVLVVVQFSISLALIIGTIIVYNQIQYSKDRPIGYNRDGLVMVLMKSPDFYGKFDVLRTELKNAGAIEELAESSSPLTSVWSNSGGFDWPGKDPKLDTDFATVFVTHEFGKTVGWQFKDGRDFSRDFSSDSSGVVLNEAAVKFMGIKDPVGTSIYWGFGSDREEFKIVGVIKDMLMQSPYEPVKQSIYFLDYENVNWITLKLNPNQSATKSLATIESTFRKHIPSAPFDYKFADEEFGKKFANEERIGKLATFFAALAIFISCLGLFGLASFVAEQRTKEIGVRKVLGASVFNLWQMLSKDFVVLVIIGFVIATPVAYYFLSGWLQKYEYRTAISWWVFGVSGLGGLLVTLLTVSFQSIKAALMNPVKSLRSE